MSPKRQQQDQATIQENAMAPDMGGVGWTACWTTTVVAGVADVTEVPGVVYWAYGAPGGCCWITGPYPWPGYGWLGGGYGWLLGGWYGDWLLGRNATHTGNDNILRPNAWLCTLHSVRKLADHAGWRDTNLGHKCMDESFHLKRIRLRNDAFWKKWCVLEKNNVTHTKSFKH